MHPPPAPTCITCLAAVAACCAPFTARAETVSTASGAGADIGMAESSEPNAARIDSPSLNTRWNGTDRNDVVGLRFDLSGYTLSTLSNLSLNVVNYRTNVTRVVDIYGVTQGAAGGTGAYTTETWGDLAVHAWGDLPGLLQSDGTEETLSIDTAHLSLLVDDFVNTQFDEGTVETAASAALTDFVQNYAGSQLITFVLTQGGSGSSGQFRFASREAMELATAGLFTGQEGAFAPYLAFDAPAPPALLITNAFLTPDAIVLAGSGGVTDNPFEVQTATNLTPASTHWPAVATNTFDAGGRFAVTSAVQPDASAWYFRLHPLPPLPDPGPIGFATVGSGITGGDGGLTQSVSTVAAFLSAAADSSPRVIVVDGTLDFNGSGTGNANIQSDKTIVGLDTQAWISGQLQINGKSNVIIRNLSISNNAAPSVLDGIRVVNGAHHVWIDHCTFVDCSDGELDITVGADYVTVSWCTFQYTRDNGHNFVNLIAASDTDAGDYRITFHHNWWSTGCEQRMPMSRYGTVHLFNNYFFAPGNGYCSNARTNAQFLSENNVYREVDDPIYKESNGRIRTSGNLYLDCTGRIDAGLDLLDAALSPPPYTYALDPATDVPSMVTRLAGAGHGPFAP